MLTDHYDLPLSTASADARDAYVQGCEAKLTMYPGAIEAFDRAIAADPGFALAHAAKAHALVERGEAAAARESMAAAGSLAAGLPAREASHVAYFALLVAGDTEAALTALPGHLDAWPRDALVLGTTAFTNGLIGSSGRAGQKRSLLRLLDRLAPSYGDDWWFTAHHGMALSENGQHAAARPMIERSLEQNPRNPWAAHATAHLAYEQGDPTRGQRLPGVLADHLSARRPALQPSELASRARPSRGRRYGRGVPIVPRSLRTRRAQRATAREAERCGVVPVALGTRRAPA